MNLVPEGESKKRPAPAEDESLAPPKKEKKEKKDKKEKKEKKDKKQ